MYAVAMRTVLLLALCGGVASAQLFTLTKDQMTRLTSSNPYERFEDGRPKVPDTVLKRFEGLSAEEVWAVLPGKGYPNQYDGNWKIVHPDKKLIGRVVTAQFMPMRPDVGDVIAADGKAKNLHGGENQWVIDQLQPGDVLVVDLFGKIEGGTFVGDNLFYYVMKKTGGAGLVIDGAIRDLEGIYPMPMPAYVRGFHPTPISNVMLTGFNIPVRIGDVTVMPGDIAFGDREGLYFVPPALAEAVLTKADETHIHDDWTKKKFDEGKYKSSDIYGSPHEESLKKEYQDYLEKHLPKK
jgi:4-hydroxy-4-methyl-2-oxoglutarate aldolase